MSSLFYKNYFGPTLMGLYLWGGCLHPLKILIWFCARTAKAGVKSFRQCFYLFTGFRIAKKLDPYQNRFSSYRGLKFRACHPPQRWTNKNRTCVVLHHRCIVLSNVLLCQPRRANLFSRQDSSTQLLFILQIIDLLFFIDRYI